MNQNKSRYERLWSGWPRAAIPANAGLAKAIQRKDRGDGAASSHIASTGRQLDGGHLATAILRSIARSMMIFELIINMRVLILK